MYVCPSHCINAIPAEYRSKAEALFPPKKSSPDIKAAAEFAEILGIGTDYRYILSPDRSEKDIQHLLGHFQNNLDLLIQKTWVEKADEQRKEKLLDRLPGFIAGIEAGDYHRALTDFGRILEELAYLFFGVQSHKEDFTEYTLRIDTQMGLFWWYGGQLGGLEVSQDVEYLRAVLMIGICYLTNF
jgi:hypothetical protein